jgi:hypothetical protein
VDDMVATVVGDNDTPKIHLEAITAGFVEMPVFEPVDQANENLRKSLNDKLKNGGLSIGLNDKLAFIKHLFNGEIENYDRVLSQLNTTSTYQEASHLLKDIVKPDYNNWEGKEEFEARFLHIVERKFE